MGLARLLPVIWSRRGLAAHLLWPLSKLYGTLARRHRLAFVQGRSPVWRAPVPVVVVGNILVGGAGKTPIVIALAQHFQAQGLAVGVISRGFGRQASDDAPPVAVEADTSPELAGDEPLLIRRKTGAPVFVSARRAEAARALLAAHPHTDVLLSDDGLQHHALHADVRIAVFDARGMGNGWLLPAGPLREHWTPALAQMVVHSGSAAHPDAPPGFLARRRLAPLAINGKGDTIALEVLAQKKTCAVAGIAQPEQFFGLLRLAGIQPQYTEALPDHYDFDSWKHPPVLDEELICTEKDAVKLWRSFPSAWAVPLAVELDAAFYKCVDTLLAARLSSTNGLPTT